MIDGQKRLREFNARIKRAQAVLRKTWNEADHPRGQPENAGEFVSGGSASAPAHPEHPTGPDGTLKPAQKPNLIDKLPDDPAITKRGLVAQKVTPKARKIIDAGYAQAVANLKPELAKRLENVPIAVADMDHFGLRVIVGRGADARPVVLINPRHFNELKKAKGIADPSPDGCVRHELGHALEDLLSQDEAVALGLYAMKYEPSDYGATSPREKFAEFFTQITKPGFNIKSLPKEAQNVARKILAV